MFSYLITSSDKKQREQYALNFCEEENIDRFDLIFIEKIKQSIGIEEIRKFQEKLYLKPIKSKFKAGIINDAQILTIEAQNALLKVLEEPPANTYLLLTADNIESLLPTIISRCKHISLTSKIEIPKEEREQLLEKINSLIDLSITEKLVLAENLAKNKEDIILYLEKSIYVMRDYILEKIIKEENVENIVNILNKYQQLLILLKTTNVNLRFAIENTLLSI